MQLVHDIKEELSGIRAAAEERETQEDKHHRQNTWRLNVIMAIVGIVGIALTAIGILVSIEVHRGSVIPFNIFGPDKQSLEYTSLDSPPQSVANIVRY